LTHLCVVVTQIRIVPHGSRFVNPVLMCVAVTQSKLPGVTPDPITRLIGQRVLERRKATGMSQTALGERMTERGSPWSRTSVAKLEAGKRGGVTVQELLALALVFGVPPVALIADPRDPGNVPVATDTEVDQWTALLWLIGVAGPEDQPRSGDETALIHAGITVMECLGELKRVDRAPDPERARNRTEARHHDALLRMQAAFEQIQRHGAEPPRLAEHVLARAREFEVDLPGIGA
jgi:transcriptional regulator with XRE-family HTH domain